MDDFDDLFFEAEEPAKPDGFFDEAYPEIKAGVKFTPIERGAEYSVYTIVDAHPKGNEVVVSEVVYTWINGYYARLNKKPFLCGMNREELCRSHSPACQGKKKSFDWRLN